jgi:hypothetical protein
MDFELVSELADIQTIAVNVSIRERDSLKALFRGAPLAEAERQRICTVSQRQCSSSRGPLVRGSRRRKTKDEDQALLGLKQYGEKTKSIHLCRLCVE